MSIEVRDGFVACVDRGKPFDFGSKVRGFTGIERVWMSIEVVKMSIERVFMRVEDVDGSISRVNPRPTQEEVKAKESDSKKVSDFRLPEPPRQSAAASETPASERGGA